MDETLCVVGGLIDESQNDKSMRWTFEFKIQIIKKSMRVKKKVYILCLNQK